MNVESWQDKKEEEEKEEEEKERERKGDEGVIRSSFFSPFTPLNEEIRSSNESQCREQVVIEPLTCWRKRLPHTDTHTHTHTHTHTLTLLL